MALLYYCPKLVVDQGTGQPVEGMDDGAVVGQIAARGNASSVPEIYEDPAGTAIIAASNLTITDKKFVRAFYIDEAFGRVSLWVGGSEFPLETTEGFPILLDQYRVETDARLDVVEGSAADAAASAAAAQAAAEGAAESAAAAPSVLPIGDDGDTIYFDSTTGWVPGPPPSASTGGLTSYTQVRSLAGYPGVFTPDIHNHILTELFRSAGVPLSPVVVALLNATSKQAARAAVDAGTGDGTSNLKVGTTATDAASGNHSHHANSLPFSPTGTLTATSVQEAIVQAAASGGGGTPDASFTFTRDYASGGYPVRGRSDGVCIWRGPVAPTAGGSYAIDNVDDWNVRD